MAYQTPKGRLCKIIPKPGAQPVKGRTFFMNQFQIEHFRVTVKHDKGRAKIRVVSLTGEQGAINQIMAAELCPRSAIVRIKKISR
jgi:hypothetical protein